MSGLTPKRARVAHGSQASRPLRATPGGWVDIGHRLTGALGSARRPPRPEERSMDVPGRTKTPIAVGEMDSLRAFLDFHRATLLWKLEGLSKDELLRPHVPSGTNLLGLVKHLTYVERYLRHEALPRPGGDGRAPPPVCRSRPAELRAA